MQQKKQLAGRFVFLLLFLTALACGQAQGNEAGATEADNNVVTDDSTAETDDAPLPTEEPLVESTVAPVEEATVVPEPTAVVEEVSSEPAAGSDASDEEESAEPAEESTDPQASGTAVEGEPFDLTLLATTRSEAINYRQSLRMQIEGVDTNGETAFVVWDIMSEVTEAPLRSEKAVVTFGNSVDGDFTTETAQIGEQSFMYTEDSGCFVFPVESGSASFDVEEMIAGNLETLQGTADFVARDVEVNGVMTNQYKIEIENIVPEESEEFNFESFSGDIFIAQDGGYVTHYILTGVANPSGLVPLDETQPATFNYEFNFVPLEDVTPSVPAGCEGLLPEDLGYPRPDDAYSQTSTPDGLFFYTDTSLDELLDFYRTVYAELGFTLVEDTVVGSFATLVFEKDGVTARVDAVGNSSRVSVTIIEQ